jgi:broad specificity phosphatase PhoE
MAEDWKLVQIDGTKMSGLVNNEENQPPRECHNCIWYSDDHCHHPVVMVDPEVVGKQGEPKPVRDNWCCGFFRSPERVLLYAVRHGEDAADHLIGGWENADIDEAGIKDAEEAATKLKNKGIRYIISSDMHRTYETASILARALGLSKNEIITDVRLRTWNKGVYNGQNKTEENKDALGWYKEHPHRQVPDGESHYQFEDRCDEALEFYICKARNTGSLLIVLHNSNMKQLQRYVEEQQSGDVKDLSSKNSTPDSVEPGGIIMLSENKGNLDYKIIFKDSNMNDKNKVVADKGK